MDQTDVKMISPKEDRLKCFLDTDSTDCVFVIGNEEINAHKRILTNCSPVFEKMFFGKMASDRIVIMDITAEDLIEMLRYIYTETVIIKSVIQAWALFYIAHKYLLSGLLEECTTYIQENIGIHTLVLSYEYAEMYEIEALQEVYMNEIAVYIKGLFHKSCEYHMQPSSIVAILQQRFLNISNDDLVEGVLCWAVEECRKHKINPTPDNIVNLLSTLNILQHLVALNFSVSHKSDNFVSECCHLIKQLSNPNAQFKVYLEKQWCAFCKCRQVYKIAGRMKLSKTNVFISNVSVNRDTILYGLVLVAVEDYTSDYRECNISINIEICSIDSPESVTRTNFSKKLTNEALIYVPLSDLICLEGGQVYLIKIDYANLQKSNKSSILYNYMSNKLTDHKRTVVFSFDELSGGVIRGLSFYPA